MDEHKAFYTYIIQSQVDQSFYIGHTHNLQLRLDFHSQGLSKYTSRKMPWKIVYFEVFDSKGQAMKRERFLKKQRNRAFYLRLINDFNSKGK